MNDPISIEHKVVYRLNTIKTGLTCIVQVKSFVWDFVSLPFDNYLLHNKHI